MIKTLFILWLVAVHAFAALAIWDTDLSYRIDRKLDLGLLNPPEITHYYEDILGSHLQLDGSVETGSVIFLGDSLTQGLNVAAITNHGINFGIGMDTSYGLLKRVPHYKSLNQASTIVVAIGINDLIRVKRSPADVLKNYEMILNKLPTETKLVIQAVFPVDEKMGLTGVNEKITQLNEILQALALQKDYAFISLQDQFTDTSGNLKETLHIGDGLHLSSEGYRLWIQTLKHTLSLVSH